MDNIKWSDDKIAIRLMELEKIIVEDKFWDGSDNQKQFHRLKDEQQKRHHHLMATNWNYAIKEHIKTGLESPTPYKVVPYKNGIGIKKTVFLKPIKKIDEQQDHEGNIINNV